MQSRISKDLVVPGELYVALSGATFLREESVSGSLAAPRDKFGLWDLVRRDRFTLFALTPIRYVSVYGKEESKQLRHFDKEYREVTE